MTDAAHPPESRAPLRWLIRIKHIFQAGDLVTQDQAPLLEPAQHELIDRHHGCGTINDGIEVCMFYLQLNQPTLGRVKI